MELFLRILVIAFLVLLALKAYKLRNVLNSRAVLALGMIALLMAFNRLLVTLKMVDTNAILLYSGFATIGIIWWALDGKTD